MASLKIPLFSPQTLKFLLKAGKQKNPHWLENNRDEYETLLQMPLKHFAEHLKKEISPLAPSYHFPLKGIGRLKRGAQRSKEYGGLFKNWMSYTATRPAKSRFEHNPSLFFLIQPEDKEDPVLLAGGLYMPSSQQLRAIRETIAADGSAFERLFASKPFKSRFPQGFSDERTSKRAPRGFDPAHPRLHWLMLQGYFVWCPYTLKQFASKTFANLVAQDCKQILRLNELLDQAVGGPTSARLKPAQTTKESNLLSRLDDLDTITLPEHDF